MGGSPGQPSYGAGRFLQDWGLGMQPGFGQSGLLPPAGQMGAQGLMPWNYQVPMPQMPSAPPPLPSAPTAPVTEQQPRTILDIVKAEHLARRGR